MTYVRMYFKFTGVKRHLHNYNPKASTRKLQKGRIVILK